METRIPRQQFTANRLATVLVCLLFFTLFAVYPNRSIVFAPDWIVFGFSTASVSVLALGMLSPLCGKDWKIPVPLRWPILVFCLIAVGHFIIRANHCPFYELFRSLSYIIIPCCAMVYAQEIKRGLPLTTTLLWGLTIAQSYYELCVMHSPFAGGLPMNVNWNAALIMATIPLVMFFLWDISQKRGKRQELAFYLPAVAVLLLSAPILKACASKGAFLSVFAGVCCCVFFLLRGKVKKKALYSGVFLIILLGCVLLSCFWQDITHAIAISDRLFFWRQTIEMIKGHWITGCGIPFFEQEFLPYRTAEYFVNEFAAVRVNHPHNHYLFIAATTGIFGLASWLVCTLYPIGHFLIKKLQATDLLMKCCTLSVLILLFHGQVDLVLFQEPTNLLFLLLLGLFWSEMPSPQPLNEGPRTQRQWLRYFCIGTGGICILFSLTMAGLNFYSSCQFRIASRLNIDGKRKESYPHYQACVRTSFMDNQYYTLYQTAIAFVTTDRNEQKFARDIFTLLKDGNTPDFAHINYYLGCLYLDNGQKKEGVAALLHDAELYPLNPRPFVPLLFLFRNEPVAFKAALDEFKKRIQALKLDVQVVPGPRFTGKDVPLLMDSFSEEPLNKNISRH